ncbi:MAG: RNA polymerase sigma factor [Pseudomonadales bacterium]
MSRADFDNLYREHYARVLGLCRRVLGGASDSDAARDATQEVFMRGYRAYAKYRPEDPFGPWISAIATNYCVDQLRRHRRLATVFADTAEDAGEPVDPQPDGVGTLISAHKAETINRAVDELPEKYRLPIVLAYYNGASYDEIAETLGITSNHVGILLLRGRQRLRRDLTDFDEEIKQ